TAAFGEAVIFKRRAFADTVLAGDEQAGLVIADLDGLNEVAVDLEAHAGDALGVAALIAQIGFVEAHGLTAMRNEDDFVFAVGEHATDEAVVIAELDAAQTAFARGVGVIGEVGLFRDAVLGGHHEVQVGVEVLHANHRGDAFAFGEREERL